jgi:ABC-2 type transport system permease protein
MTWMEQKLFLREPLTVVFTLALPLLILFVMGGIFGNTPDPDGIIYRGVGPMDFYAPAYIGLVIASVGVIGLPVQLAAYRERGVLRRFRASSVSVWTVLGSQVLVGLAIAVAGSLLVGLASSLAHHIHAPRALLQVTAAFVLSTLTFASVGVLLGALLPTARAAQGAGALLWFVMMILGGAGPPPEVLTGAMGVVAKITPAHHAVLLLQGPWLGFGWDTQAMLVLLGFLAVSALLTVRFFRWE